MAAPARETARRHRQALEPLDHQDDGRCRGAVEGGAPLRIETVYDEERASAVRDFLQAECNSV